MKEVCLHSDKWGVAREGLERDMAQTAMSLCEGLRNGDFTFRTTEATESIYTEE